METKNNHVKGANCPSVLINLTISGKSFFRDNAILDSAITKSGKAIVCLTDGSNTFYHIYDNVSEMDNKCDEFVAFAINNIRAKKVHIDCSAGYLPHVINVLKIAQKDIVFNRLMVGHAEPIMKRLIEKN